MDSLYLETHQSLLRNYLSLHNQYDNVLVYHLMGLGKTCASIAIAEGFKEYLNIAGRKITVLVKNSNIKQNFESELLSKCTSGAYQDNTPSSNPKKLISKYYQFITYGTFVNKVLGQKSPQGPRIPSQDSISNFHNSVLIIDEAHNLTNNDLYFAVQKVVLNSLNLRLILLTGTPIYDNVKEIFELTNLLHPHNPLPIRNDLFKLPKSGQSEPLLQKSLSTVVHPNILKSGIPSITPTGLTILQDRLKDKVSYLYLNQENFPKRIDIGTPLIPGKLGSVKVVFCEMSDFQFSVYQKAVTLDLGITSSSDDLLAPIDFESIDYSDTLPPSTSLESIDNSTDQLDQPTPFFLSSETSKTSSLYKNSSDASTFVYPNGTFGKDGFTSFFIDKSTPNKSHFSLPKDSESLNILRLDGSLQTYSTKLYHILSSIASSPGPVFVYSNYVSHGGTSLISLCLEANGYSRYSSNSPSPKGSFVIFDERLSQSQREKLRNIYNSKSNHDGSVIKILIGSPVISEGVTLKRVRQIHILEPFWNISRIEQIIGRGIRNRSHSDLPPSDRTVEVFKYCSVKTQSPPTPPKQVFFIDKEKYLVSEEKHRSNSVVSRFLKTIAFDCSVHLNTNILPPSLDHSPECDYQSCSYQCQHTFSQDPFIRHLHISFFDKFEIQYVKHTIKSLYSKSFVHTLNDIVESIKQTSPHIRPDTIYHSLTDMITNKEELSDSYGRSGIIVQFGDYYVFNADGIPLQSSIYSKIFDFSSPVSNNSLQSYFDLHPTPPSQPTIKSKSSKLSQSQIKFNLTLLKSPLFGTFYSKIPKSSLNITDWGPRDSTFRIVDARNSVTQNPDEPADQRTRVTGRACSSFNISQLTDIAIALGKTNSDLLNTDKQDLCTIIYNTMKEKSLLMA